MAVEVINGWEVHHRGQSVMGIYRSPNWVNAQVSAKPEEPKIILADPSKRNDRAFEELMDEWLKKKEEIVVDKAGKQE